VGTEKTAFHLGNVFCVLAALLIGGFWGGMSGAVGMTIADLTTGYVTSAPKTFLLKLCIGLITGFVAHKILHIRDEEKRSLSLPVAAVLSCTAGMAFNVVADPVVGYFYKMYILGVPQEAATIWAKMGAVTTLVNAIVAVIVASVFYLALRPALKRLGESEFRLAEKLGLRGILDDDTGEEIPEAQFYKSFADFYSAMGDHEAAFAVCQKIRELGDLSEMQYAMVLEDAGQYREAIEIFRREIEKIDPSKPSYDRYMANNRISNCLKALGEHRAQLEYQLKNYDAVKRGIIYADPEANAEFLGGEAYYLAMTYATLGEFENMMHYLTEAVAVNKNYRDWARGQSAFAKYLDNEEFVRLCGTGEGRAYSIRR
jgi:uncharacterized membrane protein